MFTFTHLVITAVVFWVIGVVSVLFALGLFVGGKINEKEPGE